MSGFGHGSQAEGGKNESNSCPKQSPTVKILIPKPNPLPPSPSTHSPLLFLHTMKKPQKQEEDKTHRNSYANQKRPPCQEARDSAPPSSPSPWLEPPEESIITMSCSNLTMWVSSKPSISDTSSLSFRSSVSAFQLPSQSSATSNSSSRSTSVTPVQCGLRELRSRIDSVKNTQKITEAMKLVAAAKVRRAQEAVVNGRPFSETLVEVLYNINEQLQTEDIDVPLTKVRPVKKVALVVVTGDRGLCGGFNNYLIKKAEQRIRELKELGLEYTIISVGKKGNAYFLRRPYIPVDKFLEATSLPTAKEAQAIADDVFSLFVSEEVDKVELLYTKFVSLVKADPVIHTLLPLSPRGEICDVNGICVDAAEDEFFRLTTKEGKLTVERDVIRTETADFSPILQFEQDPVQILDALLPLYLNSQILKALQESLASELAARMSAMSNATDNAVELRRNLSRIYNRERQAKITGEILEIVAGANALT